MDNIQELAKKGFTRDKLARWQGTRNSDTNTIEGGYLWFYINDAKTEEIGVQIHNVSNRREAIDKYFNITK